MAPISDDVRASERLPSCRMGDTGRSMVLVHGFTQTMASWEPVATDLAIDHQVTLLDAPGHGRAAGVRADLTEGARRIGLTGGRAVYVGYSMGGRFALRLALDQPESLDALVLLGTTAGIEDDRARAQRRRDDDALAARIEAGGVADFLRQWVNQPLFDGLRMTEADHAARLANSPTGLASALRLAGTGTMDPPWWDDLARISVPTLVVVGDHDHKFRRLAHRLVERIGDNARLASIDDAGHAAHLQRPQAFAELVRAFVAELGLVEQ